MRIKHKALDPAQADAVKRLLGIHDKLNVLRRKVKRVKAKRRKGK